MSNADGSSFLDFVVIGAMKAGTTSLHHYLSCHPQVSVPYTEKEVNFFNNDRNWKSGVGWYRKNFDYIHLKCGEVNPNYAMFPRCTNVPERLYEFSPDVRIIYVLRDPIERLLSHIHHNYIKGLEQRRIDEILADSDDSLWYIAYSKYYYQIEKYLQYFSPSQILLVTSEELLRSPKVVVDKVCDFISVKPTVSSEDYVERVHVSAHKVKAGAVLNTVRNLPLSSGYQRIKPFLPPDMHLQMKRLLGRSVEKPVLSYEEVAYLEETFSADVCQLKAFSGLSFSEWAYCYTSTHSSTSL